MAAPLPYRCGVPLVGVTSDEAERMPAGQAERTKRSGVYEDDLAAAAQAGGVHGAAGV